MRESVMAALVRFQEVDVNVRLRELRVTREALLEVVRAAVAAYGGCTANDPPGAPGYEVYRVGTSELRVQLMRLVTGWERDNDGNLATVRNDDAALRFIILNTNDSTGDPRHARGPINRREKGVLHERAIEGTSLWLAGLEPADEIRHQAWYLCLCITEEKVMAELSRPASIDHGYVQAWNERIILVQPGEWDRLDLGKVDDDSGPDFEIQVHRK
jgi:hypothetical protein